MKNFESVNKEFKKKSLCNQKQQNLFSFFKVVKEKDENNPITPLKALVDQYGLSIKNGKKQKSIFNTGDITDKENFVEIERKKQDKKRETNLFVLDDEDERTESDDTITSKKKRRIINYELEQESDHKKKVDIKTLTDKEKDNCEKKETKNLLDTFKYGSSYVPSIEKLSINETKKSISLKTIEKKNDVCEERYQWLIDIKDAEQRPVSHPDYDPRTIYIPNSAWAKFTPFERQYWEIKSKMWNTVVFFKKGKFYELYENDAVIANTEFDLKIAGGGRANMKLAGVPEFSFEYWAKSFISHGYKIAKVDQEESLLAKEMKGTKTKEDTIIKRKLKCILTAGTLSDIKMINDDMSIYCMSIKQKVVDQSLIFGIAFVDVSTFELNLIELEDNFTCSKLDTLISQIKPKEIIIEKNNLCSLSKKILDYSQNNSNIIWNELNKGTEFWDNETTINNLFDFKYYSSNDKYDFSCFPKTLVYFKDNHEVSFNAFGGLLYYLNFLKLDFDVMTLSNIKEYKLNNVFVNNMILDGVTLKNLEILNNLYDGTTKGTLFNILNNAITPFGKRMMKNWILNPLFKINDINSRFDSVDFLMSNKMDLRYDLEVFLKELVDLERLLARIHSKSLKFSDFSNVIFSFETISATFKKLQNFDLRGSGDLCTLIEKHPIELHELIFEWKNLFDRDEAKNNNIVLLIDTDLEFDNLQSSIKELESELIQLLEKYKKMFKSAELCYKNSGKEIYLIEVPSNLEKNIPSDWVQMGATSKFKRYWSPEVKTLVKNLLGKKELIKIVSETIKLRLYEKFNKNYHIWMMSINIIAQIDCLISLVKSLEFIRKPSSRPKFIDSNEKMLSFKNLKNPCFSSLKNFIPNDIELGGKNPNFGLITGANAAGKSTVMRTTALSIILAQVGCYVSATDAILTPIDRIMTRLGANDNILEGKSTFYVELSEVKTIVDYATPQSFIIIDELGRGGSCNDGIAIAEAVLYELATHKNCLGFFATHFSCLGSSFINHPQTKLLRMATKVDDQTKKLTFLYKIENGIASSSFGMNVAQMCGIPEDVIEEAYKISSNNKDTSLVDSDNDTISIPVGLLSDVYWLYKEGLNASNNKIKSESSYFGKKSLKNIFSFIDNLSNLCRKKF